tara:strand:+ start:147 stop:539 length:393 start_codon:yes stop_codon:yes gene_type:complete
MKSLAFIVTLLASFGVVATTLAQTYIDYPDGSTYTLQDGENIYVTPADLYIKNAYKDGGVFFKRVYPSTKRDSTYTTYTGEEYPVGSHGWCKNYVPWSEGLTFSMISWQRYCDSNGDSVYDELDERWEGE